MSELALVLLLALALACSGWVCAVLPWETVFGAGLLLTALGIVAGVPAGVVYHARLYQALAPRDALPARWWLRPVELHARLLPAERPGVMRWFSVGAAGFVLALVGSVAVAVGLWRSR